MGRSIDRYCMAEEFDRFSVSRLMVQEELVALFGSVFTIVKHYIDVFYNIPTAVSAVTRLGNLQTLNLPEITQQQHQYNV